MQFSERIGEREIDFDAARAALEACERIGASNEFGNPPRIKDGSSWVYVNPEAAVKVVPDQDGTALPGAEAYAKQQQILGDAGVPTERQLIQPFSITVGRHTFTVMATPPLTNPYNGPTSTEEKVSFFRGYGDALARLHKSADDPVARASFEASDPLATPRKTLQILEQLDAEGRAPSAAGIVLKGQVMVDFRGLIDRATEALAELNILALAQGHKPRLLQNDVTPYNAMVDPEGVVRLIDMGHCGLGWWPLDFGRSEDQWWRFRRDPAFAQAMLEGYADNVPWEIDDHMLELGNVVQHTAYATSLGKRVVYAALAGVPPSGYYVSELNKRVTESDAYWDSEEDYLARRHVDSKH